MLQHLPSSFLTLKPLVVSMLFQSLAVFSLAAGLVNGLVEQDCAVSQSLLQRKSWTDLKQDIFKKEVELAAMSEDVTKLAPKAHDRFESCVPIDSSSNMLDVTVQRTDLNQSSGLGSDAMTCNDDTDVALFWPKDTAPFYEVQCCPAKEKFCAGCAKMNSGKTSCEVCSGGYTKTSSGSCLACADLPGWENKVGENCYKASCSDELFQGFSANQACCKCGGGQATATKFGYYIGPMALGSAAVSGHPVPRTASHYSVDKDCELSKFGLSIDASTGELKLAPGCSALGCGATARIEVTCTITAWQTAWHGSSLSASAPLTVLVGHIGYGNAVVLQQGTASKVPATDGSGSFQVSCVPEASEWLSLDNTGVLSLKSGAGTGGSLTDQSGTNLGRGGVCSVQHGTRQAQVMVLAPNSWSSISYSYGASTVLYATVGERSSLLAVKGGSGVSPSRYSASCAGGAFVFDELTGVATWEGHEIFALDVKTGDLQMQLEQSLTKTLDATDVDAVRRKINLQCTIFGHYEWLPAGQGPMLTHSLQLELRDQTCWAKKRLSFAHRYHKGSRSKNDCRSLCRADATCSHFHLLNNECYFFSGICKRPNDFACLHKEQWVYEHYPGCGERGSCIDIKVPNFHYVSGKYCPRGENVEVAGQGPVYFKQGLTKQETFWLQRYDSSRSDSACDSGDWAILKPDPHKDYQNMTMGYVELHGSIVACLKSSNSDLPSDVFSSTEVHLTVKKLSETSARAVVAAPGCQKPNITGKDRTEAEEEEEMSVFPLVFDDLSTDPADDHWLHPCECVPPSWGSLPPATGDSVGEIPPGSNNEFIVPPFQIVEGEFVCAQENLLEIQVLSEEENLDSSACRTKCLAQQCPYYWEGEVMSSKQCRIYRACDELVRELGTVGSLYGMSYRKSCRIADPQMCWHVTKRRSFLGAGPDTYSCLFQDLIQQCDHKLMLGGMGVGVCGTCTYAPVQGRRIYASNGECVDYDPGNQNVKVHPCHLDKNQKWYFDGELLKTDYSDSCMDYNPSTGEVYMHSCHGAQNQLWYFDCALLRSRWDNKCLDFQPMSKNIYLGNCPGSNTQHWTWIQAVHGGQRLHTDHDHGRCLRKESDGNLKMATCDVSMENRFYFSGEELKSESDGGQCVDYHPTVSNMYMHSCHSGNNQKYYWDGQYLKSRHDDRCVDWSPHTGNVYMGNCPNSPSRRWSMHDIPAPLPHAMISNMHDGLCWDQNLDGTKNVYLHSCADGANQRWYFDGEQIKLELSGECLDETGDGSGNLYVHPCHNGDNQRFYWDGHRLHNRKWGSAKCVDYNAGDGKNLYMYQCHSGANQHFNWKIALRIKSRKDPSMCLDMNPATNHVQMHTCHHHKNQLFWFDGAVLKTDYDHSLCLDYHPSTSDLYFHACHSGDNQKFVWSGEQIKVVHDMSKCWYWQSSDNNVFGADCSSNDDQKFFFDTPYHKGKRLQSEASSDCMDAHSGNAYTVGCHDGSWQRWYFEGEQIKVEGNANKCLDYNLGAGQTENGNVNLHDCHSGSNQKWYWDGKLLKSRNDNRCLDVNPGDNNVFVGSCPNDNTQHWTHRSDLHNSRQLTVGGGKCLQDTGSNVEATGCGNTAGLMWYFDGELLKTEANNKCLDVNMGDGNLYMHNCHSGSNQKFYFDGNLIKTRQEDLCLDYQVISGNVYAGSCPHHQMSQYQMESGAMLNKHPLPEEFAHGQSLRVACWSERFKSPQTETLSCVAGRWVNSRGKRGLDGFSCAACVQVVTPKYAAFDAQIRQELFFVSGLQLQLTVDTRTPQSVTANGNLRAGSNKDIFVAELLPDAEETLRRYRSITTAGQCLTATAGNGLTATACAKEAEPLQMLEVMELSSLMWQEFKASASVPSPTTLYLANRGSAPTTLRSFVLFNGDCGDHAITSIGFYHGTRSGMTSTCTAASTYGNHVEHHIDVPGHVQISSVSAGTCLSIHHIIPWLLKDRWSGLCLDYHTSNGNVYGHACHDGNNQMWYMIDGTIISVHDGKCLDYHTGTTNVYMHECHDGSNQRWYFDAETAQIRSEYDHRCLDVNMGGSANVYIHPCHDGDNQKFDRFERSGSAFNKALQLQCSGSPEEEIKVEPIGGENKFHLKSGNHQLPGEWHYDNAKKQIRNLHSNKCLKAHHPHAALEETCMESIEQEWIVGHGLQGLADAPISCTSNQVLSFFEKGHGHIRYKCVHVAALGSCVPGYSAQVETKAPELEDVKALKRMTATCPTGHGLRALEAEASDKGAWIRLRYECCQINRVPVSLYPYIGGGGQREFMVDLADGWEGIYCPSSQDDSGRMQFSQSRSFRPHHNPSGSLQYNKFQGQWCVSGKACASSDVVHPLDVALSTHEWHVVPVSDFDAVFEARGVKPLGGNRKRSPPPLIKFGSSDPDYLPECKDESHPGARKFKLALMNKEAEDLDDENPCKYVFGKPPKNQQMDESEGMTGWIDDLSGTTEPGQGGVTYKSVKECSDRDIVRELKLAKWNKEHWDATKYNWIVEDILDGIGNSFALETAPMGFGVELNPFGLAAAIGTMAVHGVEFHYDQQIADREMHFEQAGHDDCNPIQHGFARTFCDLHCIRDAVRKGDDAILRALEEAVEIVGKNTQLLLEYYVGEDAKPGLIENGLEIKHGIAKSMGEMFAMAREAALEPRASVAATRAINVFAKRWSGANVSKIPRLVSELQDLHGTIAKLSSRKLSRGREVQRYAVQMASQMNKYMQAQSHVLGIYHHESSTSKLLQRRLNRFWRSSVSSSALLLEVEEETAEEDIKEFDSMWWEIRKELDGYLQASQEHVRATQATAQMLQDYAAKCAAGFSEMKRAYSLSVRAETHAHKILKRAWAAVSTGVAEMASKVADGVILDHLAVHDLHSLNPKAMLSKMNGTEIQVFCDGSIDAAFTVVRKAAAEAMKKGLYGQTHRQLMVLFEELKMLQSRFLSGGLGPIPDVDLVQDAQTRLQSALLQSAFGSSKVAKAMVKQLRTKCDVSERGPKSLLDESSQAK